MRENAREWIKNGKEKEGKQRNGERAKKCDKKGEEMWEKREEMGQVMSPLTWPLLPTSRGSFWNTRSRRTT